jgi:lipoprotein-releasing system ATP-binding protein
MERLFEIEHLRCSYDKHYREGQSRVVLEIEHLAIPRGKKIFIVGESGIGKSTILETLGMMNNTIVPGDPTRFVFFESDGKETDLKSMWEKRDKILSDFRLKNYSFIFQSTNLMKNFTAFENIAFTRMLQGFTQYSSFQRTKKVLEDLGLEHVDEKRMAQELSGGQQQRLAFARAILPDFTVLFGDEPTGNLDAENAVRVMEILDNKLTEHEGASAIIVSHDMHLAVTFADVIIKIRKCLRPKQHQDDEDISYGVIDESCVYMPNEARESWTNGNETFSPLDFENYLRKK